jgi:glyoxylase-like metal-dependent hydrolase (beta-lactamase superfamily II)
MSGDVPFVRKIEFDYGAVDWVSPLIRRVIARNPSPFTFHGTGTYIVGEGEVAVIDPGPLLDEHVDALMAAVAGETVTHIVITHTHHDHSPAAEPLKRATGAPTYGFGPHGPGRSWIGVEMSNSYGGDYEFRPDHRIADSDVIAGNGWTLEAIHTPGHIANHLCFALKEENALFSGDQVMGWSTTIVSPPDGDMFDYMRSLERLLTREEEIFWPTHGPPITEPRAFVEALIAHRIQREHDIGLVMADGLSRIPEIVERLYVDVPQHLHKAAGRTVLSHLVHMIQTGRAVCDGAPSTEAEFALSDA